MTIDPTKMAFYVEAASITDKQKEEFKQVSEMLIGMGRLERLSEEGVAQAVDRLAYEITKLASESLIGMPGKTNEEVVEHEEIKAKIDEMDNILLKIAFASGIHKAIIDVMVAERGDYWTEQFANQLSLMRK